MKMYKLDEIKSKITEFAINGEQITVELVRLKKFDENKQYYYTGVSIVKASGDITLLTSRFKNSDTAYANLENLYIELAVLDDSSNNVTVNENIVDQEDEIKRKGNAQFYVMNDVLAMADASARSYCETVAGDYIIGIEYNNEQYPITSVPDASSADFLTEDMTKAIEHYFGITESPTFDEEEAQLLEGLSFVPNKGIPQLTIYTNNRLQLKGDIKTMLGISPRTRVLIAFNPREQAFAVVKPTSKALTDDMRAAGYFVSKRKDVACAKLFREFNLDKLEGKTFYADKTSLSGNVVLFKR